MGYSTVKRIFTDHMSNSTIFTVFQKYIFGYFEKNLVPKEFYYREKKRGPGVSRGVQPRDLEGGALVHAWDRKRRGYTEEFRQYSRIF